jgi:hypothetical protein
VSCANFDRLDLALDEVVVAVGAVLVKVSLSLSLFVVAVVAREIRSANDGIDDRRKSRRDHPDECSSAVMSGGQRALAHCVI